MDRRGNLVGYWKGVPPQHMGAQAHTHVHSCAPNCDRVVLPNHDISIVALHPITAGQPFTVSALSVEGLLAGVFSLGAFIVVGKKEEAELPVTLENDAHRWLCCTKYQSPWNAILLMRNAFLLKDAEEFHVFCMWVANNKGAILRRFQCGLQMQ